MSENPLEEPIAVTLLMIDALEALFVHSASATDCRVYFTH